MPPTSLTRPQAPHPYPHRAVRHCPVCGSPVPELLSPSGRRRRGRPRVFCSQRCRDGDRRSRAVHDPLHRREQVAAFAAAVRAGVAARGLSLRELERRLVEDYPSLASSVATLSAWQTGVSSPPRTASGRNRVLALERSLRLPAGDLALLIPGGADVAAPRPPVRSDTPAARRARLQHLVAALAGPQQVLPVTLAKDVRLGPGGRPLWVLTTLRVRAAHDGVDRSWHVDAADPRLRPTVIGTTGCRPGRVVPEAGRAAGPPLSATELLFDRPLARGEHQDLSVLVRYDPAPALRPAEPQFGQTLEQPYERLELTVTFDPRALPAEVLRCRWRHRDGLPAAGRVVTRPGCVTYQLVVTDPAPGGYGWRWRWGSGRDRCSPAGASAA